MRLPSLVYPGRWLIHQQILVFQPSDCVENPRFSPCPARHVGPRRGTHQDTKMAEIAPWCVLLLDSFPTYHESFPNSCQGGPFKSEISIPDLSQYLPMTSPPTPRKIQSLYHAYKVTQFPLLAASRPSLLLLFPPLYLLQSHSLLDLEHAKHEMASGPLHLRSPLPGTVGPQKFSRLTPSFLSSLPEYHPIRAANPHHSLLLYTAVFFTASTASCYGFIRLLLIVYSPQQRRNSLKTRTDSCSLLYSCLLE